MLLGLTVIPVNIAQTADSYDSNSRSDQRPNKAETLSEAVRERVKYIGGFYMTGLFRNLSLSTGSTCRKRQVFYLSQETGKTCLKSRSALPSNLLSY